MIQFEEEIQNDLFRDKVKKIYNKYRLYIIFSILVLILGPFFFQLNNFYLEKKNQKFLEQYSKAIFLINNNKDKEGLKILNQLKINANLFTKVLSTNKLIEYYLQNKEKNKAIEEINYAYNNLNKKDGLLIEIIALKKALSTFEKISEAEILDLLKPNASNKIFKSTSNKILYDYYTMKNQNDKAKLFLKNLK